MSFEQAQKKQLRQMLLTNRRQLSQGEVGFKSRRIAEKLLTMREIQHAKHVHIFWPMQKNNEVDTRPLIRTLVQSGKLCILPRVLSFEEGHHASNRMEHCLYTGETNLTANRWDVYEPVSSQTVPVSRFDVIVVPALAVDSFGIRIGYGKGFYDELLTEAACPAICPVFDSFLLNNLPVEPHDVPVDIIVTERTLIRLQRNAT